MLGEFIVGPFMLKTPAFNMVIGPWVYLHEVPVQLFLEVKHRLHQPFGMMLHMKEMPPERTGVPVGFFLICIRSR